MRFDVVFNDEDRNRAEQAQATPKMTRQTVFNPTFKALPTARWRDYPRGGAASAADGIEVTKHSPERNEGLPGA